MIEESKVNIDDNEILFKFKNRKYDNNHILIVFSGFGGSNGITYDFENVLLDSPSYVLWIKDSFEDNCSYYLCHEMDFSIEKSIIKFIDAILKKYSLSRGDCTLIGFSKGGSASLYYGIKYNFKNIISTVPQFNIGTYVSKNWKKASKYMMGDISESKIKLLDGLLGKQIENDLNTNKNIYLLTSRSDVQYITEIDPNITKLLKYENFNLFYSESLLVNEHKQVTPYHVPLLLGLVYSIAQNAIPRYGYKILKYDDKKYKNINTREVEAYVSLRKFIYEKNKLYLEGVGILRGYSCENYRDINYELIFVENLNNQNKFNFRLAKDHKSNLTRSLYDGHYVNYDKGWFCTTGYNGLEISSLNKGIYKVLLKIEQKNIQFETPLLIKKLEILNDSKSIRFFDNNGELFCEVI